MSERSDQPSKKLFASSKERHLVPATVSTLPQPPKLACFRFSLQHVYHQLCLKVNFKTENKEGEMACSIYLFWRYCFPLTHITKLQLNWILSNCSLILIARKLKEVVKFSNNFSVCILHVLITWACLLIIILKKLMGSTCCVKIYLDRLKIK